MTTEEAQALQARRKELNEAAMRRADLSLGCDEQQFHLVFQAQFAPRLHHKRGISSAPPVRQMVFTAGFV